jgi:HEAT repeat protein
MRSLPGVAFATGVLLALLAAVPARVGAADADEALLKDAKIATDGPGLLEFFRERTHSTPTDDALKALVEQLGDDSFRKREQASHQLVAIGGRAKAFLQRAANDSDYEVAFRAKACLQEIDQGGTARTLEAAARLVAVRKPADAVPVLLDFLPVADDESVAEEVRVAVAVLAVKDGKADPALVEGLKDKNAVKRAACATTLARAGLAEHLPAVRKLLEDPEPPVRLRVALALVAVKEKDAVPVLIDLLAQLPAQDTGLIEDLLYRLAEDKAPSVSAGADEASRRKFRDAWAAWWKEDGKALDLAKLEQATKTLGFTMVVLLDAGKVLDLDAANRLRWSIDGLQKPLDAQMLPGDRVLVAEHDADRVTERNKKNEILWQKEIIGPLMAQRLPNGNTVVATRTQIVELDKAGKTVSTYTPKDGALVMKALKLPNGDLAVVSQPGVGVGVSRYARVNGAGKEVRSFQVNVSTFGGKIDVLANGHVMVPEMNNNRVVELDEQGKVVWEGATEGAIAAVRLPNGHTLVTTMSQLRAVELDRTGKEVWEYKSDTRVTRAFRR